MPRKKLDEFTGALSRTVETLTEQLRQTNTVPDDRVFVNVTILNRAFDKAELAGLLAAAQIKLADLGWRR